MIHRGCREGQTHQRIRFVLERFHLTHVVQYPHMDWEMIKPVDKRLAALNCQVFLLIADEATLMRRLFENRDKMWLGYIERYGNTRKKS